MGFETLQTAYDEGAHESLDDARGEVGDFGIGRNALDSAHLSSAEHAEMAAVRALKLGGGLSSTLVPKPSEFSADDALNVGRGLVLDGDLAGDGELGVSNQFHFLANQESSNGRLNFDDGVQKSFVPNLAILCNSSPAPRDDGSESLGKF